MEKIEGDLPEELSKLCSHIRKLLSQLKPMLKQVLWAWRIVFGIWKILRDGGESSEYVKGRLLRYLGRVFGERFIRTGRFNWYRGEYSDEFGKSFVRHVMGVLSRWWDKLFVCYDYPEIPPDNLVIERFNQRLKSLVRRICGRKVVGYQLVSYGWSMAFVAGEDKIDFGSLWLRCDHEAVAKRFRKMSVFLKGSGVTGYLSLPWREVLYKIIYKNLEI